MKEVYKTKLHKFIQYGKRIWGLKGNDEFIALKSIKKTYEFFNSIGIQMNLSKWKIDDSKFDIISERIEKKKIGEFPLSKLQVLNIINDCK